MGEFRPLSNQASRISTMVPPAPSEEEIELFLLEFDDDEWIQDRIEDTISDHGRITQVDDLRVMGDDVARTEDDQGPPTIPAPCPWLDAAAG